MFGGLFGRDVAIDLGTANTLVFVKGQGIVLSEPSVVAIDTKTDKVVAVGSAAKRMLGRTPGNIVAMRPLKDGVIADFEVTEKMLAYFIRKVQPQRLFFRSLVGPRVVVCVPSGVTGVELRAVKEATESAGARQAYTIEEPLAAAIGSGLPVNEAQGSMVVDVGGGTSEVAVISLGGIVTKSSIRIAGDDIDDAISTYIQKEYKLAIGTQTAEQLKIELGSAFRLEEEESAEIRGRDLVTGLPKTVVITSEEIREAISVPVDAVLAAVRDTLDRTPPELASDIMDRGMILAGGGALLRHLDERLRRETGIPGARRRRRSDVRRHRQREVVGGDQLLPQRPLLGLDEFGVGRKKSSAASGLAALFILCVASLALFTVYVKEGDCEQAGRVRAPAYRPARGRRSVAAGKERLRHRLRAGDEHGREGHGRLRQQQGTEARARGAKTEELAAQASRLERENAELRELLKGQRAAYEYGPLAQVVAPVGDQFTQRIIINVGTEDGVEPNMPVVIGESTLVGRTTEVSRHTAQVMLITDQMFAAGVRIIPPAEFDPASSEISPAVTAEDVSYGQGLLGTDLEGYLGVDLVGTSARAEEGDFIVTSGRAGDKELLFPPGLYVGEVESVSSQDIDQFKKIVVEPAMNPQDLEEVRVITDWAGRNG